ncbi:hypothetical protein COCCADRAFT_98839, partial [Bipolaris zeicola 26-R-13]
EQVPERCEERLFPIACSHVSAVLYLPYPVLSLPHRVRYPTSLPCSREKKPPQHPSPSPQRTLFRSPSDRKNRDWTCQV